MVIFFILLFIVPASPSCSLPFVSVKTKPDGYLVGKGLFILIFVCVVGKMFCCVVCLFFPTRCLFLDFQSNCIDS